MPQIHIPRLTNLLAGPLNCIQGPHLQAFHGILEEIDSTLMENTSAIQLSIQNIVKAPYQLAEMCRPLLEDLVHAQRTADHNSVGEQSLSGNGGHEDVNIPAAHDSVQHQNTRPSPRASPQQEASREGSAHSSSPSPDDMLGVNNTFDAIFDEEDNARSPAVPTSSSSDHEDRPLIDPLSHFDGSPTTRLPRTDSGPHDTTFTTDEASRESDPLDDMGSGCIYLPDLRTGKRLTRKPLKYCSPFKYGIMSRPPPNVDASMGLLGHLCADDSFTRFVHSIFLFHILNHSICSRLLTVVFAAHY